MKADRKLVLDEGCLDDWFVLHEEPYRRINGADIEGTSEEWLAIADGLERGSNVCFRRCAVCLNGDGTWNVEGAWKVWSPRNSMNDSVITLNEATALVVEIRRAIRGKQGDPMNYLKTLRAEAELAAELDATRAEVERLKKEIREDCTRWQTWADDLGRPSTPSLTDDERRARLTKLINGLFAECKRMTAAYEDGVEARKRAQDTATQAGERLERVELWTHAFGHALNPTGPDTYGEGVRESKVAVARLLRRTSEPT